jgi:hypothetical protein
MVDLSPEDLDKIVQMVYAKIGEVMAGGEASLKPAQCTFGCPNGNKFGCPFSQFKCTGDHFTCAPLYAAIALKQ